MGQGVLTAGFWRQGGALWCEDVPLSTIADHVGTPTYVYSATAIREAYRRLAAALAGLPVHVHYAMKANSALGILRVLQEEGAGVDVVSRANCTALAWPGLLVTTSSSPAWGRRERSWSTRSMPACSS